MYHAGFRGGVCPHAVRGGRGVRDTVGHLDDPLKSTDELSMVGTGYIAERVSTKGQSRQRPFKKAHPVPRQIPSPWSRDPSSRTRVSQVGK